MSPGGRISQGFNCHRCFCRGSSGTLVFPSGEDLRKASEQKLDHQDLVSLFLLGGHLENMEKAAWLGGIWRIFTPLLLGGNKSKSLTEIRNPGPPRAANVQGPVPSHVPPSLLHVATTDVTQMLPTTLPLSHLRAPIFLLSQTPPAPTSS